MKWIHSLLWCIIFVSCGLIAHAQYPDPSLMTKSEYARYCIQQLKQGALLVRLDTRSKAIALLREKGNAQQAEDLQKRREAENKEIIRAFKSNFTFCPVYFYLTDSSDAPRAGRRSGYFVNDSLQLDPSITMKGNFFLIAEEGMLETEIPPDKTQPNQETERRGTMEDVLVIRDKNYELMQNPFPYWVHFGNWDTRAKKLNKKFNDFFQH